MRPKKHKKDRKSKWNGEKILFTIVALFLFGTILRTISFPPMERAQQAIQTFLTGDLSLDQAVQAIGALAQKEQLQAVFSDWFPSHAIASIEPVAESSAPTQTLAATAAGVFPDVADLTVYPLNSPYHTPVNNAVITSAFGARTHPITKASHFHKGIDFAADEGSAIFALADSRVRTAATSESYGNYLILEHDDGTCALYAHCSVLLVQQDQHVKAGQVIAKVGSTGNATGSHLHLELWRAGKLLDPGVYLNNEISHS